MYKQNLHTHGTFADGKDEYESTVLKAIALGFDSIGFSEHSYMPYSPSYSMSKENTPVYKREIARLKEKYKEQIRVFCGLEFDLYSDDDRQDYEYIIGAVHYLKKDGQYLGFDRSADAVKTLIDTHFSGDGLRFAKAYYEAVASMPEYGKFDIVGHFDLITKNLELAPLFDVESKAYKTYALDALHALAENIRVFEVNTGAIARGYRTTPYPAPFLLKELQRLGCGVILSSDCHDNRFLHYKFDEATELVKSCGFKELLVFTNDGFTPVGI